jgi:hypothetical protein
MRQACLGRRFMVEAARIRLVAWFLAHLREFAVRVGFIVRACIGWFEGAAHFALDTLIDFTQRFVAAFLYTSIKDPCLPCMTRS